MNAAIGESTRPNRIASGKLVAGAGRRGIDYPWYDPAAFVHAPACIGSTDCSPDQYGFLPFHPRTSGRGSLDSSGLQIPHHRLLDSVAPGEGKRRHYRWDVL